MKMIKIDAECKKFFKYPQRFADFINGAFFNGQGIINEDMISPWDGEETFVFNQRDKSQKSIHRYRDIIMKVSINKQVLLLALENQNQNDLSMVLRTFEYDSMNYIKQWNTHTQMPKNRSLLPLITFVIHWGQGTFSAKKELKEITTAIPKPFVHLFNNYRMNFQDVKDLNIHSFQDVDAKNSIDLIQRIYKTITSNYKEMLENIYINKEILEFVSVITNIEPLYQKAIEMKESEMVNMCDAFKEFLKQSKNEGIEQGKDYATAYNIKTLMNKMNITATQSMDILDIPKQQRIRIKDLI